MFVSSGSVRERVTINFGRHAASFFGGPPSVITCFYCLPIPFHIEDGRQCLGLSLYMSFLPRWTLSHVNLTWSVHYCNINLHSLLDVYHYSMFLSNTFIIKHFLGWFHLNLYTIVLVIHFVIFKGLINFLFTWFTIISVHAWHARHNFIKHMVTHMLRCVFQLISYYYDRIKYNYFTTSL